MPTDEGVLQCMQLLTVIFRGAFLNCGQVEDIFLFDLQWLLKYWEHSEKEDVSEMSFLGITRGERRSVKGRGGW